MIFMRDFIKKHPFVFYIVIFFIIVILLFVLDYIIKIKTGYYID